jgi:hypothetical protein
MAALHICARIKQFYNQSQTTMTLTQFLLLIEIKIVIRLVLSGRVVKKFRLPSSSSTKRKQIIKSSSGEGCNSAPGCSTESGENAAIQRGEERDVVFVEEIQEVSMGSPTKNTPEMEGDAKKVSKRTASGKTKL